jgi:regulator of sigma E protease
VRRGDDQFVRTLVPEKPLSPPGTGPSLGILGWEINTNEKLVHPSPLEQVQKSAGQIFATLGVVFSKGNDIGVQQLGGPVMIIRAYKAFLDTENGWRRVLWFSVVLNVNLALLNMLPLPVLDGGHIVLSFIEIVRRRPVSVRIIQYIQTACALFLIGFMLFIAFFDAGDWFRSARDDREQRIVFSPKN